MQTVCCICHKTKTEERWVHSGPPRTKNVSHGYCPRCYRRMMEQVQGYFTHRLIQAEG